MDVFVFSSQVELDCRRQISTLVMMEYLHRIDDRPTLKVKGKSGPLELSVEHPQVKSFEVVAAQVAPIKEGEKIRGDSSKGRFVSNINIGDPVNGRRFRWDRY